MHSLLDSCRHWVLKWLQQQDLERRQCFKQCGVYDSSQKLFEYLKTRTTLDIIEKGARTKRALLSERVGRKLQFGDDCYHNKTDIAKIVLNAA